MLESDFYDLELIDVNESIENFVFNRVSREHVLQIQEALEKEKPYFSFSSKEGNIFLLTKYFRGLMYAPHVEERKTVMQETLENSVEIDKIKIKKPSSHIIKEKEVLK